MMPRTPRRIDRSCGAFGGGSLRSTTAEFIRVKRHKFTDAHRWPAGHQLHAVSHPVIPTCSVQLGHGQQMQGEMLRHVLVF